MTNGNTAPSDINSRRDILAWSHRQPNPETIAA